MSAFVLWCLYGMFEIESYKSTVAVENLNAEVVASECEIEKKKIALTFDDGPSNVDGGTAYLLEGLEKRGVKATFFMLGKSVKRYPEIAKQVYEHGHLIGNHSYTHVDLTAISKENFMLELEETNKVIYEATGMKVSFMRPPFGEWNRNLEENINMMPAFWSVDSLDWTTDNVEQIVNNVVTSVKENDIILMHDCYASTSEAAFQIIDILQAEGYQFVTVEELLIN